MSKTEKWREELLIAVENAAQLTVTPNLYEACVEHWWSRCERNEEIMEYVWTQLFGFPYRKDDFRGVSARARRGIYKFTSDHSFPGRGAYIAEVVATILLEGNQLELLNVYYTRLLSRKARLEHEKLQRERDYQWVQEVLQMLEGRNETLRFLSETLLLEDGEVRQREP